MPMNRVSTLRATDLERVARSMAGKMLVKMVHNHAKRIRAQAPVSQKGSGDRPRGRLKAGIGEKVVGLTGWVTSRESYWPFVLEFRSRPHIIRPVHATLLRFEIGGRVIFAREVHHPGLPATRIVSTTAKRVQDVTDQLIRTELTVVASQRGGQAA